MSEITRLIEERSSDAGVESARLFQAAYEELKALARSRLAQAGPLTLLDTTVLVNESWLRLSGQERLNVESRRQFFAYASEVMRSVIVDQIRARRAARRGGGVKADTLDTSIGDSVAADEQVLSVHEALESLAKVEPRLAKGVEMRYFGGLSETEIADALAINERTVRRDWDKAQLLLAAMLT
ncbi:ECF-type sigma factor [Steroidobacter sp.]|uniref:ECF-type sigma factor n=1 Tax=Steroidobacter sp. TaxID=1978227 RepID=UPI001A4E2CD0|nr:ECF-type sigma factor [Steroidobacter sp.]MBL8269672.1 sigma-70 family RNA polymerase sigma factor [Steroidobacter sp.]